VIYPGDSITLTARLTFQGVPLENKLITWSATYGELSSTGGITDASGEVDVVYTAPIDPIYSVVAITASFAGDIVYEGSEGTAIGIIVVENITEIELSSSTLSLSPGGSATLNARLTCYGKPLTDQPIQWIASQGVLSVQVTLTDSNGRASVTYSAPDKVGEINIEAAFPGDNRYLPSSAALVLSVKYPTSLKVEPKAYTLVAGENLTLIATLTSGGSPVVGKTITWSATGGKVWPSQGVTDETGRVFATFTAPDFQTSVLISAKFGGDNEYWSSDGSAVIGVQYPPDNLHIQTEVGHQSVKIVVSSEEPEGRTVVVDLDNEVLQFSTPSELLVLFDGEPIQMADDYNDIFDATDDNGKAEYLITVGEGGNQLLVSVPHFSTHTIEVKVVRSTSTSVSSPNVEIEVTEGSTTVLFEIVGIILAFLLLLGLRKAKIL